MTFFPDPSHSADSESFSTVIASISGGSSTVMIIGTQCVPDLPGVITVGDTREEAERLIAEAVEFHLEGLREEGLAIPTPASYAGVVEVSPVA